MMTRSILMGSALLALTACSGNMDFDLRDMVSGFDTSSAANAAVARPEPDDRGIISYPNYQVVVAQKDDTITTIAARLGLEVEALANFNGIEADVPLRKDELIALPNRVAEPSPETGALGTGPILPSSVDISAIATTALDRAGPDAVAVADPALQTPAVVGIEPIRHKVERGETVFQIARLYDVPVRDIAEWNGLGPELRIRSGQFLLIPRDGIAAPSPATEPDVVEQPGAGSTSPLPPSASQPLPDEEPSTPLPEAETPAAPDLGEVTTTTDARFIQPVAGPIIRAYSAGRNDGIDISAAAGTTVMAADAGSVAAVSKDTTGAAIIVIRHDGGILTVYTNLDGVTSKKGDAISRGQSIGKVRAGDPSFLHFEVREGLNSLDPADFLP